MWGWIALAIVYVVGFFISVFVIGWCEGRKGERSFLVEESGCMVAAYSFLWPMFVAMSPLVLAGWLISQAFQAFLEFAFSKGRSND